MDFTRDDRIPSAVHPGDQLLLALPGRFFLFSTGCRCFLFGSGLFLGFFLLLGCHTNHLRLIVSGTRVPRGHAPRYNRSPVQGCCVAVRG